MKKSAILVLIGLVMIFLSISGCERKVVIEQGELTDAAGCFTCHGDNDAVLLAAKGEWLNSIHASGNNVDYTNRGGTDCTKCHDHQGFLEFLATGEVQAPYDRVSAIHCFTCHAPHTTGTLDLRADGPYELENGVIFDHGAANLCARCHHSRFDVNEITDDYDQGSTRFPAHHGPQADLLHGTGGYEMDGYAYNHSSHATAVRDGCIGCHMGQPRTHSGYRIGGHSFNMEDHETGEDLSGLCEDCHADADGFDFTADLDYDGDTVIEGYQTEVEGLLEALGDLLIAEGVMDSSYRPIEGIIADGNVMGALHNYGIVEEDRSHGIHNYLYIVSLLQNSINYLENNLSGSKKTDLLAAHPSSI